MALNAKRKAKIDALIAEAETRIDGASLPGGSVRAFCKIVWADRAIDFGTTPLNRARDCMWRSTTKARPAPT